MKSQHKKSSFTVLAGLSEQEVWERRARHYKSLPSEEKLRRFCAINQLALMMGNNKSRVHAKITLRNRNGST